MNRADAWMPLYVADWDADTAHLSCEEDGAYGRLVRFYWKNGPPADVDALLARIVREPLAKWRKLRPILSPFFVIVDGKWTHKRISHEMKKAQGRYDRRSGAGRENVAKRKDRSTNGSTNGSDAAYQWYTQPQPHSPTFGGEKEEPPVGKVIPLRLAGDGGR